MNMPKVIDLFCGAGGFSEGFRQQGFEIILGIDSWEPAINTFNHNFNLKCKIKSVLDFESSIEEIERLPDSEVILGSPPCVSFSSSNRSGNTDKSLGVRLTEAFLRVIAVKKFKPNSKLAAWYMENVKNSVPYLKEFYTFRDLRLSKWAIENGYNPSKRVINLKRNHSILNSVEFGTPQIRKRVIFGEVISQRKFIIPPTTHRPIMEIDQRPPYIDLRIIKDALPCPNTERSNIKVIDPLYKEVNLRSYQLTDHFYDTGLYEWVWKQSKYFKRNHPYMGKMSFPEKEDNPSRTITATHIGTSREVIIYKSEYNRKGDGEYRIPTVREAACLMGFPITFRFIGTEGMKYRLVGNAVCPPVSMSLAKMVRHQMGLENITEPIVRKEPLLPDPTDLNSYKPREFKNPPRRNPGSRFRRHPFKDGNITVTLSNYKIDGINSADQKWFTSVQYGNGKGYPTFNYPDGYFKVIEPILNDTLKGKRFLDIVNNGFENGIGKNRLLQVMYETQKSIKGKLEPVSLVEEVKSIIEEILDDNEAFFNNGEKVFPNKSSVPLKQLFALYAINKISTIANS